MVTRNIFGCSYKNNKFQIVFIDKDQDMARALHEVLSDTKHYLCSWHLLKNDVKHLGILMKEWSRFLFQEMHV